MRRTLICAAGVLLLLLALAGAALAEGTFDEQSDALGVSELTDALPKEVGELLGEDFSVQEDADLNDGLARLYDGLRERLRSIAASSLRGVSAVVLCALLCSAVSAGAPERTARVCSLAGVLAVAAVCVYDVNDLLGLGGRTVETLHDFSTLLLPCLAGATAATGAIASSAVKYGAAMLFMNVLLSVQQTVVLPVIYAYTAAGLAGAALGTDGLSGAESLLKWVAVTMMRAIVIAFVTYLAVSGIITGSTDAARLKLAKTTVSTVLPVVGGILSDASETVLAGAAVLKNAVGVFGLIAAAAICAVPFLRLGANYLLFKGGAAVTAALGTPQLRRAVDTVTTAFGMILALVGTGAVMVFLSVVSFMKAVA